MRVSIHYRKEFQHHAIWADAFTRGLGRHGIVPRTIDGWSPTDCDLAVFWGHHFRSKAVREVQLSRGLNYLVAERGYVGDRKEWTSLGYNGLNGQADFCNENSPGDRWKEHPEKAKAWSPGSKYILLIGQVPTDSAVLGINFDRWVKDTTMELEQFAKLPVVFRPHPLIEKPRLDLEKELISAACVVTYSSTAGVNAVLAGKPVIAFDPRSMVWPIAGHELADVFDPPMPDRKQWLNNLAYSQWTLKEIERGVAWEHLKRGPKHADRAA